MNLGDRLSDVKILKILEYEGVRYYPEKDTESFTHSSIKIMCWLRFKEITNFNLDDMRVAFPEWSSYAKGQLIYKINPLIKNKSIQQLQDNSFKVLK